MICLLHKISCWASRHVRLAIFLLISGEIINALDGILLGANLLATWPGGVLLLLTGAGLMVAVGVRRQPVTYPPGREARTYAAGRWQLARAFGSTFLLAILLGGLWGQSATCPAPSQAARAARQVRMPADTIIQPRSATAVQPATAATTAPIRSYDQTGKRIGYVLLFVLGLVLLFFSVGLACDLACSGHGFGALLVLGLGFGFVAGGMFFMGRATDRPLKPMRDLTKPERRRALRRFWLGGLVLLGITGLLLLLSSLS